MARARAISGLDPQASTGQNARIIARERLAELYAFTDYLESPANIQELHDMRITAKRLRYTLEIFAAYLPAASQKIVEELTQLQDELGAMHDSEVMLALLHLSLQPATDSARSEQVETELAIQRRNLLAPDMIERMQGTPDHAPSQRERQGLESFLRRQEERREQSYAAFRQHWEQLEQRHFHEEILEMLEHDDREANHR
ncbi:MAG TPA: CHAD domain-containing protein [Ktedonobacteraceae bacterium]|nr:CHAD domain-containing protein [Ktedonobacteraceae bacterium]